MQIRLAHHREAAAICTVLRRSITELCMADHRNDPEVLEAWLANKTPDAVEQWIANDANELLVAANEKSIIGVGCVTTSGEIMLNYVAPDARFRGVSKAMMGVLEAIVQRQGYAACTLDSTETAHRFYLACGYVDNGVTGEKLGLRYHPMIKNLVAIGV